MRRLGFEPEVLGRGRKGDRCDEEMEFRGRTKASWVRKLGQDDGGQDTETGQEAQGRTLGLRSSGNGEQGVCH